MDNTKVWNRSNNQMLNSYSNPTRPNTENYPFRLTQLMLLNFILRIASRVDLGSIIKLARNNYFPPAID